MFKEHKEEVYIGDFSSLNEFVDLADTGFWGLFLICDISSAFISEGQNDFSIRAIYIYHIQYACLIYNQIYSNQSTKYESVERVLFFLIFLRLILKIPYPSALPIV